MNRGQMIRVLWHHLPDWARVHPDFARKPLKEYGLEVRARLIALSNQAQNLGDQSMHNLLLAQSQRLGEACARLP
jgi:hypothetical protein